MTPRIYDPGDLEQYDGLEIAAIVKQGDNVISLDELTQQQADAYGEQLTWSVFLHLQAGHVTDLADGFKTKAQALAFAASIEPLLPNLNPEWSVLTW